MKTPQIPIQVNKSLGYSLYISAFKVACDTFSPSLSRFLVTVLGGFLYTSQCFRHQLVIFSLEDLFNIWFLSFSALKARAQTKSKNSELLIVKQSILQGKPLQQEIHQFQYFLIP